MATDQTGSITTKDKALTEEEYQLAYTMKFENCTFNNCNFYQTGKPEEDDPPGSGDKKP